MKRQASWNFLLQANKFAFYFPDYPSREGDIGDRYFARILDDIKTIGRFPISGSIAADVLSTFLANKTLLLVADTSLLDIMPIFVGDAVDVDCVHPLAVVTSTFGRSNVSLLSIDRWGQRAGADLKFAKAPAGNALAVDFRFRHVR